MITSKPKGWRYSLRCQQKLRLNYNRKAHTNPHRATLELSSDDHRLHHWAPQDIFYIGCSAKTGRCSDITDRPNKKKQTQEVSQNEERKKLAQMYKQNKTPKKKKELKETQTRNLLDTEFKTLVIRMLNELRGRIDELNWELQSGDRKRKKELKKQKELVRNEGYNNWNEEYSRGNQ